MDSPPTAAPSQIAGTEPVCFVVMPFDRAFDRVFQNLIAPACLRAGFRPERADRTTGSERITDHILRQLLGSDLVLGDLTARNPNVLYELGVRHACGGRTVLIQAEGTDRIFDIQDMQTLDYDARLTSRTLRRDIERLAEHITATRDESSGDNLVFRSVGDLGPLGRRGEGYRSFLARLPHTARELRVLTTFAYFLNDAAMLAPVFQRVLDNSGDARILLVEPGSAAAAQRERERPGKDVALEIRNNLRTLAGILPVVSTPDHARVECRTFNRLPPFALFQCDGQSTLVFYEPRKDLKDTQSLTFATRTPVGAYFNRIFTEHWNNAETTGSLRRYLALRGWLGADVGTIRYLYGHECRLYDGTHPDLWLLLSAEQFEQVASWVTSGRPAELDDAHAGRYELSVQPIDVVKRVAVQKYGSAPQLFEHVLAATRIAGTAAAQ